MFEFYQLEGTNRKMKVVPVGKTGKRPAINDKRSDGKL